MASAASDTPLPAEERRIGRALARYALPAFLGGAALLVVSYFIGLGADNMALFWHAYLLNFAFVASIAIGGLFFVLACHLFGARWATSVRRLSELVAGSIGVVFVLFLPIAYVVLSDDQGVLYPWTDQDMMAEDALLRLKIGYLNPTWFVIRAAIIFAVWGFTAWYMKRGSLQVDETGDVRTLRRLQAWSGPLMLLFALSLNVAAFDWFMSLDPMWFSTIFGVYFWAGSLVAFLATLLLMIAGLHRRGVLTRSVRVEQRHDIAKLMFAMVIFWGYVAFSQFMLIWYGNIPEETQWYADRQGEPTAFGVSSATGWLFIVHLFIPFLGFMSKRVRRNPAAMTAWAAYLLVAHWFDLYYIIMPSLVVNERLNGLEAGASWGLMEGLCLAGMVAVLAGAIARGTADKWLTPVRDPRMRDALSYVNH